MYEAPLLLSLACDSVRINHRTLNNPPLYPLLCCCCALESSHTHEVIYSVPTDFPHFSGTTRGTVVTKGLKSKDIEDVIIGSSLKDFEDGYGASGKRFKDKPANVIGTTRVKHDVPLYPVFTPLYPNHQLFGSDNTERTCFGNHTALIKRTLERL